MIRVLLDTNILLDLFLERPEFVRAAEEVWEANRLGRFEGYVSALTPPTILVELIIGLSLTNGLRLVYAIGRRVS